MGLHRLPNRHLQVEMVQQKDSCHPPSPPMGANLVLLQSMAEHRGWFSLLPFSWNPLASPADCHEKILRSANFPFQCSYPAPCHFSLWPGPKQSSSKWPPCFHSWVPPRVSAWQAEGAPTCPHQSHHSSLWSSSGGFRLHVQSKLLPWAYGAAWSDSCLPLGLDHNVLARLRLLPSCETCPVYFYLRGFVWSCFLCLENFTLQLLLD